MVDQDFASVSVCLGTVCDVHKITVNDYSVATGLTGSSTLSATDPWAALVDSSTTEVASVTFSGITNAPNQACTDATVDIDTVCYIDPNLVVNGATSISGGFSQTRNIYAPSAQLFQQYNNIVGETLPATAEISLYTSIGGTSKSSGAISVPVTALTPFQDDVEYNAMNGVTFNVASAQAAAEEALLLPPPVVQFYNGQVTALRTYLQTVDQNSLAWIINYSNGISGLT